MSNLPLFNQSIKDDLSEETWSEDVFQDIRPRELDSLVVYSRDWTVETIASQIRAGNITLDPGFQRGNAWNDEMRSRLIESLIINFPVPEIVFAENRDQKQSFIVLDGKQRLMTIAGYIFPHEIDYWIEPKLSGLKIREDLNGLSYQQLETNPALKSEYRQLVNSDVRCTVIAGYESDDVLYEIFHRLNTTSVPLNLQELRQVLYRGPFSDFLTSVSEKTQTLQAILGSERADLQARKADLILRFLAFTLFGREYRGNLKAFLDGSMKRLNEEWTNRRAEVEDIFNAFNASVSRLIKVFGRRRVGRRYEKGKWEGRFNKALFEVEAYYFMYVDDDLLTTELKHTFVEEFKTMSDVNMDFRSSIESTTKTPARYEARFRLFRELVNRVFSKNITVSPL
jgi:Protein of unknown function DUF262